MKKCLLLVFGFVFTGLCKSQSVTDSFRAYLQKMPGSTLQFKMVPIPGGSFLMGSTMEERSRNPDEGPQRNISISPFWMGSYEVSRDEFDIYWKDQSTSQNSDLDAVTRPSSQYVDLTWGMGKQGGYPVNSMSQFAALMYCRWLYSKTGVFYRLPTEAEWEYACRAGSSTAYYFGSDEKDLDKYAWYSINSGKKFQKSGQKLPNAWGLYDMLGNVSEWTLDHYDEHMLEKLADKTKDPMLDPNKAHYPKTLKGGSFFDEPGQLRSASRIRSDPSWNRRDPQVPKSKWWLTEASNVGFRIVRPFLQPTPGQAEEFYSRYLP